MLEPKYLVGGIRPTSQLKLESFAVGESRPLIEHTHRNKISRSGHPAREDLRYDHTAPDVTHKTHRVEEFRDGEWNVVHDEAEEFPAKHRQNRDGASG